MVWLPSQRRNRRIARKGTHCHGAKGHHRAPRRPRRLASRGDRAFGYGGREYEIDLNEEHAAELDELLAPYVERGRRVQDAAPKLRARRSEREGRSSQELRTIRQWAREQGLQVSDRGRISADIIAKYDAAH